MYRQLEFAKTKCELIIDNYEKAIIPDYYIETIKDNFISNTLKERNAEIHYMLGSFSYYKADFFVGKEKRYIGSKHLRFSKELYETLSSNIIKDSTRDFYLGKIAEITDSFSHKFPKYGIHEKNNQ